MTECWHDYTKDPTSMNVLLDHRCFGQEDIVQCVKCGDKSPLFLAKGYMAAMRLATAALAEKDAEIERLRKLCKMAADHASGFDLGELLDEQTITVCDKCLMACCWQGEFMCDEARDAGITEKTIAELRALNREHPEYWQKDLELKGEL